MITSWHYSNEAPKYGITLHVIMLVLLVRKELLACSTFSNFALASNKNT